MGLAHTPISEVPDIDIQARLYLFAVLPVIRTLSECAVEAQPLSGNNPWSAEIVVRNGIRNTIQFSGLSTKHAASGNRSPTLKLLYLSNPHLVNSFENRTLLPPLPLRGFFTPVRLWSFLKLSNLLKNYLNESPGPGESPARARTRIILLFSIMLAAIGELNKWDRATQEIFQSVPPGCAQFEIPRFDLFFWCRWMPPEHSWGMGPATSPEARIVFTTAESTMNALNNCLDHAASVGSGDIVVDGLTPLADGIGAAGSRVAAYLDPRRVHAPR